MLQRLKTLGVLAAVLVVAACTTPPKTETPKAHAEPPQKTSVPAPEAKPAHPANEYEVRITSEPAGGLVVIDGVPRGKTPLRIGLAASPRGFCRDQVSIKVRFVATDAQQSSHTVEELLTPLDKIPPAIHFTPNGATRTAR